MYVTLYAAYGIYHAEDVLKSGKITYIYIVTKSMKRCIYVNFQTRLTDQYSNINTT